MTVGPLVARLPATAGGIAAVAVGSAPYLGSARYLGSRLGPGLHAGLMAALVERTGWRVGACRALLEFGVLFLGMALDGPVRIATIAVGLRIGPAVQRSFPLLRQTPVRCGVEAPA